MSKHFSKYPDLGPSTPAHRHISHHLGITASVLLSQLIYYASAFQKNTFNKTDEETGYECGLTISELKTARKKLVDSGLITYIRKGVPASIHYTINELSISEMTIQLAKSYELVSKKSLTSKQVLANKLAKNDQPVSQKTLASEQDLANQLAKSDQLLHSSTILSNHLSITLSSEREYEKTDSRALGKNLKNDVGETPNPQLLKEKKEKTPQVAPPPPSKEEAAALFLEFGRADLSVKFWSYYQARGWANIFDWKAAAANWIEREKEYSPKTKPESNVGYGPTGRPFTKDFSKKTEPVMNEATRRAKELFQKQQAEKAKQNEQRTSS